MTKVIGDPIGKAIQEYAKTKKPDDIIVSSEICEDDIIPVEVLFRTFDEMPEIETLAVHTAKGRVLDVGAGAGAHALEMKKKGCDVLAIDISKGAVDYMISQGLNAQEIDFFKLKNEKFDSIIMLMNGIGIAGSLANLENTLRHAKSLMNENGQLIFDSSDIKYLYEDEDGSLWVDLNTEYYGNFRFKMKYKGQATNWFDWLYVDFDTLFVAAQNVGLKAERLYNKDNNYLAVLKQN
jgi:SAM-dependent methyltransferase